MQNGEQSSQLEAVHVRHLDVGEDEVKLRFIVTSDGLRLLAVGGGYYVVPRLGENARRKSADERFIVHHEHTGTVRCVIHSRRMPW